MRTHLVLVTALAVLATARTVNGYELRTHQTLSKKAAEGSVLSGPDNVLDQLGLRDAALSSNEQIFPNVDADSGDNPVSRAQTILELIGHGAMFEDTRTGFQPFRHFYNPLNGQPLVLPLPPEDIPASVREATATSPDWILEDNANYSVAQPFSYKDARQYFYDALTLPSKMERDRNWGLTFQTLGHVIHHLQDMAQPQHVRNDLHCDNWKCRAAAVYTGHPELFHPGRYEKWAVTLAQFHALPASWFVGYGAVYPYPSTGPEVFTTPRKFWSTKEPGSSGGPINDPGRKGIAEYTNRGFFSASTITDPAFNSPTLYGQVVDTDMGTVCADAVPSCPEGIEDGDRIVFRTYTVSDSLRGLEEVNSRAVSDSVFDEDLKRTGHGPVFALNRFNFEAAYPLLLKRAVGYSAGLINYFFRGKMEISLPDEGLYGVVDHLDPETNVRGADGSVIGGFRNIKLKVKNVTTRGTDSSGNPLIEPMGAGIGELRAVVKYHVNNCYHESLSGEYGSPGINWADCRSQTESISVSSAESVQPAIDGEGQQVMFTFLPPIPISATDLYLQVVYRGRLGEESGAVAVATKDISEPTYSFAAPKDDQYLWEPWPSVRFGPYTYEQRCAGREMSLDECKDDDAERHKFRFSPWPGYDPASSTVGEVQPIEDEIPFAETINLPPKVGEYARAAFLTEAVSVPDYPGICLNEFGITNPSHFYWIACRAVPTINQYDDSIANLVPSARYWKRRGAYILEDAHDDYGYNPGNAPDLQPIRSIIQFPTPSPPP